MHLNLQTQTGKRYSVDQYDLFIRPQILAGSFNQNLQEKAQQKRFSVSEQEAKAAMERQRTEQMKPNPPIPKAATSSHSPKSQTRETVHRINKTNPSTIAIRTGLLLSMKTNYLKVAEKLRFAFLSTAEAKEIGIRPVQHQSLQKILQRLQRIYYSAGGNTDNLKTAILEGRGNQDGRMQRLSGTPQEIPYNIFRPLKWNLGPELYAGEGLNGSEEISTAKAMSAAAETMNALVAVLKSVGKLDLIPAPQTAIPENETNPEPNHDQAENKEEAPTTKPKRSLKQWIRDNRWGISIAASLLIAGGLWLYKRFQASKAALAGVAPSGRDLGTASMT